MKITFDPRKRALTLGERGLDFQDAVEVFGGLIATRVDDRRDYGEVRWITAGYQRGRFVLVVWTERTGTRRIISMRYGHGTEEAEWFRSSPKS